MTITNDVLNAAISPDGFSRNGMTVLVRPGGGRSIHSRVPASIVVRGPFDTNRFMQKSGCGGSVGSEGFVTPYTTASMNAVLDEMGVPSAQHASESDEPTLCGHFELVGAGQVRAPSQRCD